MKPLLKIGLTVERKDGFIQIEWQPVTTLPQVIRDSIDYTGDGKEDFAFLLDTVAGRGTLPPRNPSAVSLQMLVRVNKGGVARIPFRRVSSS